MDTLQVVPDLASVNTMDRPQFVATLGPAFEHSPWVAQAAWRARPFASVEALHAAMLAVVTSAPADTQLAFLCAHPELAGKEAQACTLTDESQQEQASAGLSALSRDEMAEMQRLNRAYRERHGFPFIIAARRHGKAQIFGELRRRIDETTETERAEALAQIARISRLRVEALVAA